MVRISGNNSSAPTSSSSSQSGRRQSNRKKKGIISSSSSSSTLGSVEGVGAADEASVPKSNRDQQEDKKNENDVNKVVVRRLPPGMTEAHFLESVAPLPDNNYLCFYDADQTLDPYLFTWATINFLNEEDVFNFREKFDGYVFVDGRGHEYPAVVEYAPHQRIPKRASNVRKDAKMGTIGEDPEFLKFVESLQNQAKAARTIQKCIEDVDAKEKEQKLKETTTPLLEFIKAKRLERRERQNNRDQRSRKQRKEAKRKKLDDKKRLKKDLPEKRGRKWSDSGKPSNKAKDGENGSVAPIKAILSRPKDEGIEGPTRIEARSGGSRQEQPSFKSADGSRRSPADNGVAKKGRREKERPPEATGKEKASRRRDEERPKRWPRPKEANTSKGKEDHVVDRVESAVFTASSRKKYGHSRYEEDRQLQQVGKVSNSDASNVAKVSNGGASLASSGEVMQEAKAEAAAPQVPAEAAGRKDRRAERDNRKNKERPAMQIYRPGMGKFSSKTIVAADAGKASSDSGAEARGGRSGNPGPSTSSATSSRNRGDNGKDRAELQGQKFGKSFGGKSRAPDNRRARGRDDLERENATGSQGRPCNLQDPPPTGSDDSAKMSSGKSYSNRRKERQLQRAEEQKAAAAENKSNNDEFPT